ncbi:MAG: VWA domain-containing protein [Treponemataceae bacterium]|nr:VWA domain-containing protein [Spirochaetales bacterium]MDY6030792.1 VWA domain-containing protein [Treponemataceae bacterium]
MITFENYYVLLLLLGIPLFIVLYKTNIIKKNALPALYTDWQGDIFTWNSKKVIFFKWIVIVFCTLAYICVVIAMANPRNTKYEKRYISRGTEVMFILDISPSMAAMDLGNKGRIDCARETIMQVVNSMTGTSFGIIAIGTDAACVMPPSLDTKLFERRLYNIKLGEFGDGTALGVGISSAVFHLASSMAPQKVIILMTDGENNAGTIHPYTAAKLAKEEKIPIYVMGIGTQGTVPIEYTDPVSGKIFSGFLDSKFDTESLSKIAEITNGSFYEIQDVEDLTNVTKSIVQNESVVPHFYTVSVDTDFYRVFLALAEILAIFAWMIETLFLRKFF